MNGSGFLGRVTAVVLTWEEEANLGRTLTMLGGMSRVLVIDSGSGDGTRTVAEGFPAVDFVVRSFDTFERQWNYALDLVETEWVLALDADYVLSPELRAELESLDPSADWAGYEAGFEYWLWGQKLRGSLYPPKVILFRKGAGVFEQDGHAYRLRLEGRQGFLAGRVRHDDRKPLERWWKAQWRYAGEEAAKLDGAGWGELSWADRVRRLGFFAPWLVFGYTLIGKGMIFGGVAGWGYVLQRTLAEMVLSLRLVERRAARMGGRETPPC